ATVAHAHVERRVEPLSGVEHATAAQEQGRAGHGDLQRRFRAANSSHREGKVATLCRHGSGGAAGTAGAYGHPTMRPRNAVAGGGRSSAEASAMICAGG